MRMEPRVLFIAAMLLSVLALAACGAPGIDRVDVTWDTDPPPRWGLYPGYRQEIPCPRGATYHIDVYSKGKAFTGAAIAASGGGLAFKPTAGARDIEAEAPDATHLVVYATLNTDGQQNRRLVLRVERKGEKIYFEFPK
ncbi:MAG: hypothetical protein AUJ49_06980 [Desulfovibrionaceae bacterium CG1_02_65_16]|nr:MAG: hypothetical protein AUJ49_06980 [Desulfovibrionaceae bacterium CG1_02_65_16]